MLELEILIEFGFDENLDAFDRFIEPWERRSDYNT
jgi:hypothetical protein